MIYSSNTNDLIENFQYYWSSIKRRWLPALAGSSAVITIGTFFALTQPPSYLGTGKLLVKRDETTTLTGLRSETEINYLTPLTMQGNPMETEIEIILSQPLLDQVISELNILDQSRELMTANNFKERFEVENIGGTDIIQINYEGDQSQEIANVINTLMNKYVENNVTVNRIEAQKAKEFLAEQLPITEEAVKRAESKLREFKEKNEVLDLKQEAVSSVELLAKLDEQIAATKSQFEDANTQLSVLQNRLKITPEQSVLINAVNQSKGIQEALLQLQSIEADLTVQRTFFQDSSPQITDLSAREEALQKLLSERLRQVLGSQSERLNIGQLQSSELQQDLIEQLLSLESKRFGLSSGIQSLSQTRETYKRRADVLPRLEQYERQLTREVEVAQATYEKLLERLQELALAENENISNARVIEFAQVPSSPVVNKKKIGALAGSFVFSFILFISIVFILEILDSSLKSIESIKLVLDYEILGIVRSSKKPYSLMFDAKNKSGKSYKFKASSASYIKEQNKILYLNLESIGLGKKVKLVGITGVSSNLNKSVLASNLALTAANAGNKVLLVDADVDEPKQHIIWNIGNQQGFSEVLEKNTSPISISKEVSRNLHVLTIGSLQSDFFDLLISLKEQEFKNFFNAYDLIFFDIAPIQNAADSLLLAKMLDGLLLTAQVNVVRAREAIETKQLLDSLEQKVLGTVISSNSTKLKGFSLIS